MAYQATVIPIMIATPGDVSDEREIIRDVIHEWNDVNASPSRVVLSPVGWETHSSPELGIRAQELINSRLLKDCDLLIAVFWTRLGTPTGEAKSGTVEEIERHLAAGKPAMIYFSSKPVAPESIDSAQFAEVQKFKARCKELGLVEFFDDARQFKEKFARQLQLCLIHNAYLQGLVQPSDETNSPEPERSSSASNYRLSVDAKTLLKAAATKEDGSIFLLSFMSGRVVQAGGQQFGGERGRESAKWEHALGELVTNGLAVARGNKGQVFELTHEGWSVADAL